LTRSKTIFRLTSCYHNRATKILAKKRFLNKINSFYTDEIKFVLEIWKDRLLTCRIGRRKKRSITLL